MFKRSCVHIALILAGALSAAAQVQPCPTGTLANVLGTTCSVGNLILSFDSFFFGDEPGRLLTPADIGFIPVQSNGQSGFKLVMNFADVTNPSGGADHFIQFTYAPHAAPNFEIQEKDVTADATAQSSPGGSAFVQVVDIQNFPPSGLAPSNIVLDNEQGVVVTSLPASNIILQIPALAADNSSSPFASDTTALQDQILGTASASLSSATFLYTVSSIIPTPGLAPLAYKNIDLPGVSSPIVSGLNDAGQTVGSYLDASGVQHGYLTNKDGGFTTVDFPSAPSSELFGINNHGDVVGSYLDNAGALHGFLFQHGTFTPLDFANAILTIPISINDKDEIAGEYETSDQVFHGFLYQNGQFTSIDQGTGNLTVAEGINNRGDIAGILFDPDTFRGFVLSSNVLQTFDVPGQGDTEPEGINDAGDIVGTYEDINFVQHGVLRSRGNLFTVDFPGGSNTFAENINSSGQIVGIYIGADGNTHSFLATPGDDNGSDVAAPLAAIAVHPAKKFTCGSDEWKQRIQHSRDALACQPKH